MAETYNMKALCTFYGTGGYIAKGQEFFTTSKELGDFYVQQQKAVYTDGTQAASPQQEDLKLQAKSRNFDVEEKDSFNTSNLERNVTSLANPINIKIAVDGVNPEDLNVEVVRDTEVQAETKTVEQSSPEQQNQQYTPQEQQSYQPQNQQNLQPQYEQQAQQPQQNNSYLNPQYDQLKQQEEQLLMQLNEIQMQQEELFAQNGAQNQSQEIANEPEYAESNPQGSVQSASNNESAYFEVRHVGGGWYDLPNGERVQGKVNAENRMKELANGGFQSQAQGQVQGQQQGYQSRQVGQQAFPNPERVKAANTQPAESAAYPQNAGAQALTVPNGNGFQDGQFQARNQEGQFTDGRGANAQSQPRNSEGEFTSTQTAGAGNTGVGGSSNTGGGNSGSGGASTSGNTGGGNTGGAGGTGGGTSGPNSGSGGGASTSGNTGQ